ncbi:MULTISPECIES: ABC transporter ATP-binding protein [Legionella]|uniref:ABC transporter ATP-binding protein n=1 Tax=Legionella septentrionalis TaxID=2498109 RepID=A0A433JGN7_9GAMM|nr:MULTISPECIES: ABC transporter ATP-binding protein [Legionella]MCP0914649.1 ABC transporter ATP-binding protein/permease [Legionella sp. 27cVA30]RUQ81015.1 ABC transporter ATP-binding protein [Legionella septentrionalis]RUQ99349.1 ABC transporter ATP-binding protein [Legionella septentrionalis]RUR08762.1 ABC transporter ATP-binding protein [Legionella septentrionalis]RUR13327.1 ABC transporter ATP-binding protein [Legionella septentrionalis]
MSAFFPKTLTIREFLWSIIKPYRWWYILLFQASFVTALYVFANNYSLKLLVDAFSLETSAGEMHHLIYPITLFIAAQIILDISWRLSNIAAWKAEPHIRRNLLLTAYDYVQHHSYAYFQNTQSGSVVSKLKGLLDKYDSILNNINHVIGKNFFVVVLSIFVLLLVNTAVFIFMLGWCALVVAVLYPMGLKLNQLSEDAAESKHTVIGLFADNITNIFSLFHFATRRLELERAQQFMSKDYVPRHVNLHKYDFKFNLVGTFLYWFMIIAVFIFMVYLREQGKISIGDFVFVMLTAIAISFDLWALIAGLCEFMKEVGDFKSSFSVLATPHSMLDHPTAKPATLVKGAIEFKNLSFKYDAENTVFENLNLTIAAGEKIGLIGHSGAGKSTLISLLLKNFRPASGEILLDGQNIEIITADSLRRQIALIPQDIMLFHRSIGENIAYAKEDASQAEVQEAAQLANIHAFIMSLPQQYGTAVGERGVKLSGGQRQRIAIARAFLKKAPIIVLDEATSSLDSITEQQIQQSIDAMLTQNNATVIAIAHRLSTIRHMDRIIVLGDGKIIEQGSFNELIDNAGYFKKLWDSQVNGMVL